MAAILKQPGAFAVTPHKVSLCILLRIYTAASPPSVPSPFSSASFSSVSFSYVSEHNRLASFLLALTKSYDDILEPKLDELIHQLRILSQNWEASSWVVDQLTSRLSSLSSPDDLFNFFNDIREILGGPDSDAVEDDRAILDINSILGMFLRRCILAFNLLSFEGICYLLTSIGMYCKDFSNCSPYEGPSLDDSSSNLETHSEYENMDLENFVYEKVSEEIDARKEASERVLFHLHMPDTILSLVNDIDVPADSVSKRSEKFRVDSPYGDPPSNMLRDTDSGGLVSLRTNCQVQGYLQELADTFEKNGGAVSSNGFEIILQQLQKLAPELHRVHFLSHLNGLAHDDYIAALENLHCYFDYSAGTEGIDFVPPVRSNSFGRYEIGLLCLGMMHFHLGHPKLALEVLTEAVRASQQQNNDTCLAYTLAAISNLLFENGISSTAGILGSSYSPFTSIGISLSVQQQLFVLLRGSLTRAENLKLKRLVASNHLAMAKFELMHVQRPLLSFGPKTSMKLSTCPVNVSKELRLSSHLISDFTSESSPMTIDGAFSTAWLRNLQKPVGSPVLCQENGSGNNSNVSQFCAQPTSIPGSVLQVLGSSCILRATAWELYGSSPLSRINALLHATCFADASSSADAALAYVKLIQHLAVFKGYKEAFSALKIAEEKFLSVSKSQMLQLKLQLLHEHALHRGRLKLAQKLCDELSVLASPVTGVDMVLKTEASLRHARTLLAAKQFREAAAVAHSLFCMCYKYNLQVENASVLLLLAEIHKKSGNAVLGLPYALASLSFCTSFNLDLLKASATLTLAELWLSLGSNHATRALNLVHGAFPMILGHGGLELRSRAYIVEAKCYLCNTNFNIFEDYNIVIDPLRQASEELQLLEFHELAAEAFYLMAMVYDKLGQYEEREEAAASFQKHTLALDNPQDQDDPLISTF
ncbi:anaphase-promoting complex subunit 5-like [Lotus japonicus]|uniref:anaphase-promoting complex subunit 5-like n=1 Tax=Lotus japonicus TaxID=34305 RepID=UPI00258889F7|nr:anaphase-promoting complex subunit 5-like [Lotus japonicus]